ncbi:uncharacterized protein K02A2.6-like [Haliotis rubra]|uniref:uncharacterized protein K02A2.6-like n=2 Tax=Haliotis rubra TaxID=36100 RepID=UPI001EE5C9B3|nr:uncharacterized protein K02A2.6-like [Haliotis rubra]
MKKPLTAAPARLQRMLLQLQKYDLRIVHVAGKDIPVADTLSRKFLTTKDDGMSEEMEAQVHMVLANLPVSDHKMSQLRDAINNDVQMQQLRTTILNGWPDSRSECPESIIEYWNHRDQLTVMDGLIFKGEKIIIPKGQRSELLQKIHSSHFGMEKCKERARDILFWPGMNTEIEAAVANCTVCCEKQRSNSKEPLQPHEILCRPWQKVCADLFTWNNKEYIVLADYYSRFFKIDQLRSLSSSAVIRKLSVNFARHRMPEILMSDNGPQFASAEFADFASRWDFKHITSSPRYPQSNGLAEKCVQISKNILDKTYKDGIDPLLALLEYRTTPVDNLASPAQLLMSRRLRSVLPTTGKQLQHKVIEPADVCARREQVQSHQKLFYDRAARNLPPLQMNDSIYLQTADKTWKPAQITRVDPNRSYQVQTADGAQYQRNKRHLRHTPMRNPSSNADDTPTDLTSVPLQKATASTLSKPTPSKPMTVTRSGRVVRAPQKSNL